MTHKYRIFIINTDYPDYVNSMYNSNLYLKKKSFSEQSAYRMETLFGTADFYSKNLRKLGYEAIDIAMLLKNGIFLISKDVACANISELNNKGRN